MLWMTSTWHSSVLTSHLASQKSLSHLAAHTPQAPLAVTREKSFTFTHRNPRREHEGARGPPHDTNFISVPDPWDAITCPADTIIIIMVTTARRADAKVYMFCVCWEFLVVGWVGRLAEGEIW